jgi:DNA-binding HxlR family transcriptional regulator
MDGTIARMTRRTYDQYCATARTLDLVGERWSLLIVRELLSGAKRFTELQDALSGIGAALLSARLRFLEAEGLVHRVALPPPARAPAYDLTEAGFELEPAILALARWGMRWALGERREEDDFEPGWAVLGMHAIFDPEKAGEVDAAYEFRVGAETFHVDVKHGAIETGHGPARRPDAVIETTPDAFAEMAAGSLSLKQALADRTAAVSGDREAVAKLRMLFTWPQRRERTRAEL